MIFPDKFICYSENYSTFEKFVPAPLFRRKFTAKTQKKAELIITGLGFYRAFINGNYKRTACALYKQSRRYCIL